MCILTVYGLYQDSIQYLQGKYTVFRRKVYSIYEKTIQYL